MPAARMAAKRAIDIVQNSRHFLHALLGDVRADLASALTKDLHGPEAAMGQQRVERLFDYTMADGKFARSNLAFRTFMALSPTASEEQLDAAGRVAVTLEMLQTFFLIEDDIMDGGKRRRGKACWHTLPGIGLNAINDGLLLDCGIDKVIRRAIPAHPRMQAILHDIAEAKQKSVVGQMLDTETKDLAEFTWTRYASIVEHKTSHYSYYLPLVVGMHLADCSTPHHTRLRQLAYRIGHLFQAQDDFLDCFGDPAKTGKSNLSDLAEGKCTWVICELVAKLQSTRPQRLEQFRANFGRPNEQQLSMAMAIVLEEGIREKFAQYQDRIVEELHADVHAFPVEPLRSVLRYALDDIVNRQK